jgi:hypothetical protein
MVCSRPKTDRSTLHEDPTIGVQRSGSENVYRYNANSATRSSDKRSLTPFEATFKDTFEAGIKEQLASQLNLEEAAIEQHHRDL